jgi:CRP/FNR family cyclic AMP-dependent transcriptional regulator
MATATQMMAIGISARYQPPAECDARGNSPYGLPITEDCASHTLRDNELAGALSSDSLQDLDRISHPNSFPAGALLFVEGQTARGVYLLCHGYAKLMTTNRDGKTLILKIARPGEILGLDAVISGRPYEFTVETLHASQLAFVSREDFLRFLRSHGDACLYAAQHLSRDCRSVYESIRSIGLSHSVTEKLARLLLQWSADARSADGTVRIKVALTHEEIAQLIGSSRETVTRILGEFKKRRVLEVHGSTVVMRNVSALENLARG